MPSRKRAKGKARRAKEAASEGRSGDVGAPGSRQLTSTAAQLQQRPASEETLGLELMSLEDTKSLCTHRETPARLGRQCFALLREYEAAMQRIFDNVIAGEDPSVWPSLVVIEPLFVHHTIMQLFDKKGLRVPSDLEEEFSAGMIGLGVNYILEGRKHFIYPYPIMATAAAITLIMSSQERGVGGSKIEDVNRWGERDASQFFAGRIKCSCLEVEHCNHGCQNISVGDHTWTFMNAFETTLNEKFEEGVKSTQDVGLFAHLALKRAYMQAYGEVDKGFLFQLFLKSGIGMKEIAPCLLSMGTNIVLQDEEDTGEDEDHKPRVLRAASIACAIISMDPSIAGDAAVYRKSQDVIFGGPSEWARFFADRIPCSCLAERKKREKNDQRMSWCWNCGGRKKRRELFTCTRCQTADYCSAKCQAANWPKHKDDCDTFHSFLKIEKEREKEEEAILSMLY